VPNCVQQKKAKGETITPEGDYALVSVGRRSLRIGAENAGVRIIE
jgi:dihydrolipoamide dehydrogenase